MDPLNDNRRYSRRVIEIFFPNFQLFSSEDPPSPRQNLPSFIQTTLPTYSAPVIHVARLRRSDAIPRRLRRTSAAALVFALLLMLNPRLRGSVARGTGRGVDSSLLDPVSRKRKGETLLSSSVGRSWKTKFRKFSARWNRSRNQRERERGRGEVARRRCLKSFPRLGCGFSSLCLSPRDKTKDNQAAFYFVGM